LIRRKQLPVIFRQRDASSDETIAVTRDRCINGEVIMTMLVLLPVLIMIMIIVSTIMRMLCEVGHVATFTPQARPVGGKGIWTQFFPVPPASSGCRTR
jgi:hypothetical protein